MFEWQVIYSKSKRQYYFRFRSISNNRTICWSEYYHNRADAVGAIQLVQTFGPKAPIKDYVIA